MKEAANTTTADWNRQRPRSLISAAVANTIIESVPICKFENCNTSSIPPKPVDPHDSLPMVKWSMNHVIFPRQALSSIQHPLPAFSSLICLTPFLSYGLVDFISKFCRFLMFFFLHEIEISVICFLESWVFFPPECDEATAAAKAETFRRRTGMWWTEKTKFKLRTAIDWWSLNTLWFMWTS